MTTRTTTPLGAPCWIDLMSSDPAKSRHFYSELFGWTAGDGDQDLGGYAVFSKGGHDVGGLMQNDPSWGAPDGWGVHLAVADARATAQAAADHGAQLLHDPMEVKDHGVMVTITDPGGAVIGAWQPLRMQGLTVLEEPDTPAWFELHTREYDTAVAFYRDVFGWTTSTVSDTAEFRYTVLDLGDGVQAAGIMDGTGHLPEGVPSHWAVYFRVDDVDKALARIEELGGSVTMPAEDTPYGRLATATDSTGAAFRLQQLTS